MSQSSVSLLAAMVLRDTGTLRTDLTWSRLNQIGRDCIGLDWTDWVRLNWTDWVRLDWTDWVRLDWTDWARLDWTDRVRLDWTDWVRLDLAHCCSVVILQTVLRGQSGEGGGQQPKAEDMKSNI